MTTVTRARLRLTLWYLLALAGLVALLTAACYILLRDVQGAELHDVVRATRPSLARTIARVFARDEVTLIFQFGAIDLGILILAALGSYSLAGRTLRPLQETLEQQRALAAAAAHDLRSPLMNIMGYVDIMKMRLDRGVPLDPVWIQTHLAALSDVTRRMRRTVDDVVEAMQIQAGHPIDLSMEEIEIVELTHEIAAEIARSSPFASVRIDAPPALVVLADRARLARALQNIIANAVRYSPPEAPVQVEIARQGAWVATTVRDHGPGIAADDLARLGTPFYRAAATRSIMGTGLGLTSARNIVDAHGGRLHMESRVGEGTTITILLPAPRAETAPPSSGRVSQA